MEEIIYFSVNNWFCGEHYPPTENFKKWLGDDCNLAFTNDEWCRNNKLCVNCGIIDMSINFTVSAPKSWVEKNCPELLPDKSHDYNIVHIENGKEVVDSKRNTYSDFVYTPEKDKPFIDKFGQPFLEYKEDNLGFHYYDEDEENSNAKTSKEN